MRWLLLFLVLLVGCSERPQPKHWKGQKVICYGRQCTVYYVTPPWIKLRYVDDNGVIQSITVTFDEVEVK